MEFRKVLCEQLSILMKEDKKIVVLDADLAKPNGTYPLYKEFPDRCFEVGIAESNMVSVAAGLSSYGYKPVIVTFAPFATRRVFDQLAVSVAYSKQNVKVIGTDPGLTAELNGGTHMTFLDMALMRGLPNFVVYDAVDDYQLKSALKTFLEYDGNVYIRMPRKTRPSIFDENYIYHFGKADLIKEGKDVSIIASGVMVYEAIEASKILKENNIDAEVISINTIRPLDKEMIIKTAKKTKLVFTCENHNIHGGLYSNVCEVLASEYPTKVIGIGIDDQFGQVGKYDELLGAYKLTKQDIAEKIKSELNK